VTVLAVRYTGRHVRQARHGAWVKKTRSRSLAPRPHLLPAAAAFTVAGFLVGGASAAIGLAPASASELPAYDPADILPPDPNAGQAAADVLAAGRAPIGDSANEAAALGTIVIATGSCEVSYQVEAPVGSDGFTATHETLPVGTLVRVTNPANGDSVVVRINDRSPASAGDCLDLSPGAFASIADPSAGVADIRYEVLAQDAT
jgi:rare lipoprotein A